MALKAPPVVPPVPFTWTGIYIGGFGGGAWGSRDPTDLNAYADTEAGTSTTIPHAWAYGTGSSPLVGGTIDLDYQTGWFVVGAEGQAGYIHLSGSAPDPLSPGLDVVSSATLGNWFWFAGGRAGVAWDRALFYGKVGAVFTQASATITDTCSVAPCGAMTIAASGSYHDQASLAVGGGIEYAFAQNWSVRLEYMYWALNNKFNVAGVASNGFTYNWQHNFSGLETVMLGVGYTFNTMGSH
jgi:outer membrane immunogenic protein